jgi:competence protein ComFC
MVHDLKYRNVRAAAPEMGRLLAAYLKTHPLPADILVPVPLHSRRERARGYNQSQLLAQELSKLTSIPVETSLLRRIRHTPPQVEMETPEERKRNIQEAFQCLEDMEGRTVLLIDDVPSTQLLARQD